jgi:hypothetical protein
MRCCSVPHSPQRTTLPPGRERPRIANHGARDTRGRGSPRPGG